MMASCLLMLPLAPGCGDDKGGASQGSSTTDDGATDDGATDASPTEGGTIEGSTSGDHPTDGSAGSSSTTGDFGGASLCEGACDRLIECEVEDNPGECLSWCAELEDHAATADPQVFTGCAALVEQFLECVAQDDTCFESNLCADLDVAIEEQCGCEFGTGGNEDDCTYEERCGSVSREVHCTGGTCVCTVNGEAAGECQAQAMICVDPMGPKLEAHAAAAGECCGWVPFEQGE
ncbi:hypothetical protein [Nannocystis sp. SCPEA4]|uniref:hypothetical protein n=1 Tax=Nannocystis sp. SCPEA4 TaxID=2996787 RepID=UPI00226E2ACF|nr:hypothetical protein [Nannocystis sp. SCPEA4]MCY1061635.1 hypothetical protein [Nannocystis sp. SCPEA4]